MCRPTVPGSPRSNVEGVTSLHDLTALEQAAAVAAGDVTATELVEHYLDRVERLDDVGAFITVTGEQARARAAAELPKGPLAGVPTAIKDLNLTAGVRTTFGSAAYDDFVPPVSDAVTEQLESGGLISLGKTSTPEFGSPCYTEPEGYPAAVTPWDRSRMAGGSSGGAAAAVAAGLVPVAQGSDGGGSIRIPASCCGLVGLKPSRGRISGAPMYGEVTGLATPGTIARTVRDAAAMLDVLAGHRVGDPSWAPAPDGTFLAACDQQPGRLRIARFIEPVIAEAEVHPEVVAGYEQASAQLESLGHDVVDIPVPLSEQAVPVFETIWAVLTALSSAPEGHEDQLRPLTRWLSARGHRVSGPQFGLALGEMRRLAAGAVQALAPFDAVLTPTLAQPPLPVGALRNDADPEADFEAQKAFTPWTSAWNVTGMPALSLPMHWTADDLPVGMMLAGRPTEEATILALAAQLEADSDWRRTPPGW